MKKLVCLCILLVCCQKAGTAGTYEFSERFEKDAIIVRLSCYQTKSRHFYSESYLLELDDKPTSIRGEGADSLWRKLKKQVTVTERLASFKNFTSKDYQLVAENDRGELSSIVITKTYLRDDGRYVACIMPNKDFFSDLSKSEVASLGIK